MKSQIFTDKKSKKCKIVNLCFPMILGASFLLLSGCSKASTTTEVLSEENSAVVEYSCISNPESEKKIYAIIKNYHGDYWKSVIEGIGAASEETDAAIYIGGIDNEVDISGQIGLVEQAIEQGADGILLAPVDSTSLIESCKAVQEQKIPLVLIDSSINSSDYDICYMTDNMKAGNLAAREMLAMLKDAGHPADEPLEVGILLSSDTSQAMINRVSGFLEYWTDNAPAQWEVAEDIFINGGDLERAQSDVSALLKKHDNMKGLLGCNNTSTKGIANMLLAEKRTDITMVGFDLAEVTRQFIQNPDYQGKTLLQKQDEMAYQGILSLDALIEGEAAKQKYFDTGVVVVDEDNLAWRMKGYERSEKK